MRGPRRVGKTVLLLQLADHLLREVRLPPASLMYVDLSDPLLRGQATGAEMLATLLRDWPSPVSGGLRVAMLDELQVVPGWDAWLKSTLDWHENLRVVATGSSSLGLARGGKESGRGRWEETTIEGMTFPERLDLTAFPSEGREETLARRPQTLREHLEIGGLPEYLARLDIDSFAEIRRDIRAEVDREIAAEMAGVVRDVDVTRRLFRTFAQGSGSEYGRRKLAELLSVDKGTLDRHIEGLSDMLLIHRLSPATATSGGAPRSIRQRLRNDKIYVADPGYASAFAPAVRPLDNDTCAGMLFETAVYHALRSVARDLACSEIGYLDLPHGEIDFLLNLPEGQIGVEVTKSMRWDKKLQRAREVCEAHRIPLIIVGGASGDIRGATDILCLDLQEFLLDPAGAIQEMAE